MYWLCSIIFKHPETNSELCPKVAVVFIVVIYGYVSLFICSIGCYFTSLAFFFVITLSGGPLSRQKVGTLWLVMVGQ